MRGRETPESSCTRVCSNRPPRRFRGLVGVVVVFALSVSASAADRTVLGELFTATWCSGCPAAGAVASDLIDAYPDTFAVVEYHVEDSYAEPFGQSRRDDFYLGAALPGFFYDGLFDAWPIETYESKFLDERDVPTTVTLSVGAVEVSDETYQVTTRVCMEPRGIGLDLRVYVVVVEDNYPTNPSYSRNTFRTAAATEDIILSAEQCYVSDHNVSLEGSWDHAELKIIAWVQGPADWYPAEVHQAAKMGWPFQPLPAIGDWDNNGRVDLDDYFNLTVCLTGPDPETAPSQQCREVFDADGDDDVDIHDYSAFQNEFAGSP